MQRCKLEKNLKELSNEKASMKGTWQKDNF